MIKSHGGKRIKVETDDEDVWVHWDDIDDVIGDFLLTPADARKMAVKLIVAAHAAENG